MEQVFHVLAQHAGAEASSGSSLSSGPLPQTHQVPGNRILKSVAGRTSMSPRAQGITSEEGGTKPEGGATSEPALLERGETTTATPSGDTETCEIYRLPLAPGDCAQAHSP